MNLILSSTGSLNCKCFCFLRDQHVNINQEHFQESLENKLGHTLLNCLPVFGFKNVSCDVPIID